MYDISSYGGGLGSLSAIRRVQNSKKECAMGCSEHEIKEGLEPLTRIKKQDCGGR